MSNTILVTGATGHVGSAVIAALRAQGQNVIAGVHSGGRRIDGVPARSIDLDDPASLRDAFAGVNTLFLMQPLDERMVTWNRHALDAAKRAGVTHVVRLSGAGAQPDGPFLIARPHGEADRDVRASGIAFTLLQPVSFMQNYVNYHGHAIQQQGAFYLSQGEGQVAFIDLADVAAVAAKVLGAPAAHAGKAYVLTGPQALSNADVANRIAAAAGKPVQYVNVPDEAAVEALLGMGLPRWNVDALLSLSQLIRQGHGAVVSGDVHRVLGRAPRRFEEYAATAAAAWR
jgi:uncharacterized protein YbjT (DUF2867 family)